MFRSRMPVLPLAAPLWRLRLLLRSMSRQTRYQMSDVSHYDYSASLPCARSSTSVFSSILNRMLYRESAGHPCAVGRYIEEMMRASLTLHISHVMLILS